MLVHLDRSAGKFEMVSIDALYILVEVESQPLHSQRGVERSLIVDGDGIGAKEMILCRKGRETAA